MQYINTTFYDNGKVEARLSDTFIQNQTTSETDSYCNSIGKNADWETLVQWGKELNANVSTRNLVLSGLRRGETVDITRFC